MLQALQRPWDLGVGRWDEERLAATEEGYRAPEKVYVISPADGGLASARGRAYYVRWRRGGASAGAPAVTPSWTVLIACVLEVRY